MDIYLVMFLVKTISNPVFDIIHRFKMSSNIANGKIQSMPSTMCKKNNDYSSVATADFDPAIAVTPL